MSELFLYFLTVWSCELSKQGAFCIHDCILMENPLREMSGLSPQLSRNWALYTVWNRALQWGQGSFQWTWNHVLHLLLYPALRVGALCPLTTLVPIWTSFIISKLGTNRSHLPRLLFELNDTRILYCMLSLREYKFSRVELENAWQQLLNKDKRHWCFCSYGEKGEKGWQRY